MNCIFIMILVDPGATQLSKHLFNKIQITTKYQVIELITNRGCRSSCNSVSCRIQTVQSCKIPFFPRLHSLKGNWKIVLKDHSIIYLCYCPCSLPYYCISCMLCCSRCPCTLGWCHTLPCQPRPGTTHCCCHIWQDIGHKPRDTGTSYSPGYDCTHPSWTMWHSTCSCSYKSISCTV